MLDVKFIRQNPDKVKNGCIKKGVNVDISRFLTLDQERRRYIKNIEYLKSEKNKISELISKKEDSLGAQKLVAEAQKIKNEIEKEVKIFRNIDLEHQELLLSIPNMPLEEVPEGKGEEDNVVLRKVGKISSFNFAPKDYLEIAENLDLIDVVRAGKVSGSRFGYFKNEAVLLEFALIKFALDILLKEKFIPIVPPVMIRPEMMKKMGYIKETQNQKETPEMFFLKNDDLVLVGTSEQSIGPYHVDEILEEKTLPKRYLGFSTCFRREAGSYGKDTRGILRVHQFNKIEMFSFSKPKDSLKEHKLFLSLEEKLMQALKLPYQVIRVCSGDMAFPTAEQYDIETWIVSENKYRETHSTSNCTDFQAKRLNIRYKDEDGNLAFVHTVNGTVFAIGRILIAIIENYQQKDGSILVPEVLQKYLGLKFIGRK